MITLDTMKEIDKLSEVRLEGLISILTDKVANTFDSLTATQKLTLITKLHYAEERLITLYYLAERA